MFLNKPEWIETNFLHILKQTKSKQELQEVLKFPIEMFWNLEASLKSELLYF